MISQTISHYKILEKIGEGGMGVVYKAQDLKLQRPVALKFLPSNLLGDEEAKARFLREARAAAALQHPNICTIHEIDEADGHTFIVMAYLEGEGLRKHIEKGPLNLDRLLDIAIQVARGLQEAHGKGVVHKRRSEAITSRQSCTRFSMRPRNRSQPCAPAFRPNWSALPTSAWPNGLTSVIKPSATCLPTWVH